MSNNNRKYLDLITSEYANKEKFNKYAKAMLDMLNPAEYCLASFDTIFKLDNAVGDQLDKCGRLVGLTRELPLVDADVPSVLPDDLFRDVIKARILANHWDGTIKGWEKIIEIMVPGSAYNIVDNQDMSVQVVIVSKEISIAKIALLFNGYIIPKPAGVKVNWLVQEKPMFGWDSDNAFIKGWDSGIWNSV